MAVKTSIPKGTRDFTPEEMTRREYIFDSIKKIYKKFGYLPIETPAMENLSTLMGKYGEEGDRLIFKILNSGNFISKIDQNDWEEKAPNRLASLMCEKALRYDLTVPFARFIVQHQNEIQFPFKRYQIQPVWRADKPQKGRYREFFQCDADVIGSNSLLNEVELVQIIDEVFQSLNIPIVVKINNRKVLAGIAETIGEEDKIIDITVAIDKLDKIGFEKVIEELQSKGISNESISKLKPVLELKGSNLEKITKLKDILKSSETGIKGIEELEETFYYLNSLEIKSEIELDLTLARGLNYYTGAIFEVKAKDATIGSICGGGRYDDLTGIFGLKDVSGVGISFGADRIYDVMLEKNLFPEEVQSSSKIMFVNFGKEEAMYCMKLLSKLRAEGIKSELFPDAAKMKKQMNYADKKQIPFVGLIGSEEMNSGQLTIKNMQTGEQNKFTIDELLNELKK